jgi:glutathione peroxidase
MKSIWCAATVVTLGVIVAACSAADKKEEKVTGPLSYKLNGIDGKELDLSGYKGKVVLFVNVASKCGFTKQYTGLQSLYEKYGKAGLVVVGVPSNDFGKQEPGTNEEIQKFCSSKFNVTFPMTAKVAVKGDDKAPLYKFLTDKETNPKFAGEITWNFEKFLVNRKGEVVARFKPADDPESDTVLKAIQAELDAK